MYKYCEILDACWHYKVCATLGLFHLKSWWGGDIWRAEKKVLWGGPRMVEWFRYHCGVIGKNGRYHRGVVSQRDHPTIPG